MLHLKANLRFHFRGNLKFCKECEEKDAFYTVVDGPLDSGIKGCTLGYT